METSNLFQIKEDAPSSIYHSASNSKEDMNPETNQFDTPTSPTFDQTESEPTNKVKSILEQSASIDEKMDDIDEGLNEN